MTMAMASSANMEETTSEEGGGNQVPMQTRSPVNGDRSVNDDEAAEQGVNPPAATASDPKFSISDDDSSGSNDVRMEDQPLDNDEEDAEKSGAGNTSVETGADDEKDASDNIVATTSSSSNSPTPSGSDDDTNKEEVVGESAIVRDGGDATKNPPSPPPRLNKVKNNPDAIISPTNPPPPPPAAAAASQSPAAASSSQKSTPQSRRSPSSGELLDHDESDFGPFEESQIDSVWNPFGDHDNIALSGELFHVDDDDDDDDIQGKNNAKNSSSAVVVPYERNNVSNSSSSSNNTQQTPEEELDSLRRVFDSEYERALEDQEISWRARYGATRLSFIMSALLMIVYLWLGCMFYRSEAGWSVPDALLFTVYTVTTVGYGGPQPLPNTAAFHAFTSMYVLVGISLVTVLGAHTYQLVTLEATRMRSSPWRRRQQSDQGGGGLEGVASNDFGQEALTREMDKYRQQFMNELEDLARERPLLDATLVKMKEIQMYMRTTKCGRFLSVALPFLGMIFLGAIVVGTIENWSPMESIYWSIVTLTTVGYGDYVPTKKSSVWFCTLFFIPSSLFFLSFLLAHVAKSYIRIHAIHVNRLERKMRRNNERSRAKAERAGRANRNAEVATTSDNTNPPSSGEQRSKPPASPGGSSPGADDVENGFTTTVISYTDDDDSQNSPTKSIGLFGDQTGIVDDMHNDPLSSESSPSLRYRENVIRNKESAPDPKNGNRAVSFAEALKSLNRHSKASDENSAQQQQLDQFTNESSSQGSSISKPSLDVRLRVQARLARIIAEEVAGHQTGVIIKGSTVSLTVGSLRDTADKWKIPPQAWKAFRAVAFRSLLFVGERELISDGGDALLRLNVVEFHQIFSPMLAAMGDGSSMEAWLAATDILADIELRGGAKYGRGKPIFNGTFT